MYPCTLGLLYMSNYGTDFKGGRLVFTRQDDELNVHAMEEVVEPKKGRIVLFTSGKKILDAYFLLMLRLSQSYL